jgi:hypothetical protein
MDGRLIRAALTANARRLEDLDRLLENNIAAGGERVHLVKDRAQAELTGALDRLVQRVLAHGLGDAVEVRNTGSLQQNLAEMQAAELRQRAQSIATVAQPLEGWVSDMKKSMAPHLESMRSMSALLVPSHRWSWWSRTTSCSARCWGACSKTPTTKYRSAGTQVLA